VLLIGYLFASDDMNARRLQFWLPTGTPLFGGVDHQTPAVKPETWNLNGWQSRIKQSRQDHELVYDRNESNIKLTVKLTEEFNDNQTYELFLYSHADKNVELFKLTFVVNESSFNDQRYNLLEGSSITATNSDWLDKQNAKHLIVFINGANVQSNLIIDSYSGDYFSVPPTQKGKSASLQGKRLYKFLLLMLMDSSSGWKPLGWRTVASSNFTYHLNDFMHLDHLSPYTYRLFIGHPSDVKSSAPPETTTQISTLITSNYVDRLTKDAELTYTFSIDQTTFRPDGWPVEWPADAKDLKIPLIYGVMIYKKVPIFPNVLIGGALKALSISWSESKETDVQIAPSIDSLLDPALGDSPSLGKAQFIDFTGSSIQFSDAEETNELARAPVRMNTVFARQLINRAETGMATLLSWDTQQMKEPPIPNGLGAQPMDFSGAYYQYFLELFLYLPWLVAHRLNQEQQYDEARLWLSYIFDPSRQSNDSGHPGYWQSVPLEHAVWPGPADPSQAILYPDDPHQIALSFPVHFQKALYGLYIDIESNQADQAYRELTPDGLAEAKLRYVRILDLLGPRPDVRQVDDWTPITLDALSSARNEELREFEGQLIETQRQLQEQPPLRIGNSPDSEPAPLLCLRPYGDDSSLASDDNPYLRRPFNPELIQRWDRAESRLYNLRHQLDMAGKPLNLPLFAAPLDPRALLAAWGQGLSGASISRLLNPQIPHYRFNFMFVLAQNAVDSVIQFGSTLLSLIERKESAQYLELQQQQAWNLAKAAVEIQTQAFRVDEKTGRRCWPVKP